MKLGNLIVQIGKCTGCERLRKLDDGVCDECLTNPHRGRKWAAMAFRVRQDPKFAATVYGMIRTDAGKKVFVQEFGVPDGASAPGTRGLRLVHL